MPISRDDLTIFLVGRAHFLVRFAHFLSKICFGSRFRVTAMTNPVLTENDGKHPRGRFCNRFSKTVITSAVLKENDGKCTLHPKVRIQKVETAESKS